MIRHPYSQVTQALLCLYLRFLRFSKLFFFLFLLLSYGNLFSQVLNVTQAGLIENGFGKSPNLTGASSVFVKDNYAYSVGTGNVLEIIDITLPRLPVHKGSLSNGEGGASIQRPQSVFVQGNYAYITSYGSNTLEIVDVSDPAHPVHKSMIRDGDGIVPYLQGASGLFVSGNYAYVASGISNAIEIIDISNPALPVHKGVLKDGGGVAPFVKVPVSIYVDGTLAYIRSPGALEIADVSNPAIPVHKGSLLDGGGVAPYLAAGYGLFVSGNYAYVTSYAFDELANRVNDALEIVDVSNPSLPVIKVVCWTVMDSHRISMHLFLSLFPATMHTSLTMAIFLILKIAFMATMLWKLLISVTLPCLYTPVH